MHADHVCQSGHQSSESSGRMRYLLILLLCTVVLVSCQEEYVYPSVVTEFIDARTNGEGKLTWLITDQGDTLDIQERSGLDGLCANSTYRTITIYEHLEEEASQTYPMVKVYSVQQILSISPVDKNNFSPGEISTDPLDIQSIWRSGNYLNLILLPLVKEGKHIYMAVETAKQDSHEAVSVYAKAQLLFLDTYIMPYISGFCEALYEAVPNYGIFQYIAVILHGFLMLDEPTLKYF